MIKVISFDIGGTLLTSKSIDEYTLKKLTELLDSPYEKVRSAYKNVFQKKKGSLNALVNYFCDELDIEINDKILSFFQEKFSSKNNEYVLEENIETLIEKIKEKGFKIILLSNSCCLIKNSFSDNLLKNIDEIFYSYDYGYTKDEEEFYKIVQEKLNCKAEEILHVGDTLKSDYILPKKFGWNAIYYGEIDDPQVQSINELNEIINIMGDFYGDKGKCI